MRERISYYSDGLKLSGILNTPDNSQGKRFPGVLLVPGFMSTADAFFPGFADELNRGGFVSLTMDFRGFGQSEGVRGEVIPYLQIYDASNAISYLQSRPEVNPDKIAILGVSLGGGEANSHAKSPGGQDQQGCDRQVQRVPRLFEGGNRFGADHASCSDFFLE